MHRENELSLISRPSDGLPRDAEVWVCGEASPEGIGTPHFHIKINGGGIELMVKLENVGEMTIWRTKDGYPKSWAGLEDVRDAVLEWMMKEHRIRYVRNWEYLMDSWNNNNPENEIFGSFLFPETKGQNFPFNEVVNNKESDIASTYPESVHEALCYVYNISEEVDYGRDRITHRIYKNLMEAKKILEAQPQDRTIASSLRHIGYILEDCKLIELHNKTDMRAHINHRHSLGIIERVLLPKKWLHNDKIGVYRLRRRLILTEKLIKCTAARQEKGSITLKHLSRFRIDLLKCLMGVREYLLNRMFFLGCSDAEAEGFRKANDILHSLHLQMYERCGELWRRELASDIKEEFDDDITIEGKLFFSYNIVSFVKEYDNDDWYGSDFSYMMDLEDELLCDGWHEIESCHASRRKKDTPEKTDTELGLENYFCDGESWADGIVWFCKNPKIKDVFIHHPMHSLVYHQYLPLPDIVRIDEFQCEVNVLHQKISDQKGKHYPLIY